MTSQTEDLTRTDGIDQPSQIDRRLAEFAFAYAEAAHELTADPTGASTPLPELADPQGEYHLTAWITFTYDPRDRGPDDKGHWPSVRHATYILEGGRTDDGRWHLKTSPKIAERVSPHDGDVLGEPIVNLRDQEKGLQPLTLLRALLAGRLV